MNRTWICGIDLAMVSTGVMMINIHGIYDNKASNPNQ